MIDGRRLVIVATLAVASGAAQARVQDYQIIRLLTYRTACQPEALRALPPAGRTLRYHAGCLNLTFFPEGVDVACEDPDDEQSCHVVTQARSFDHLRALQGEPPGDHAN